MFVPEDYTKVIMVTLPSKLKVSKYIVRHYLCIDSLEPEIERLNACRKIIQKCSHNIMPGHKVDCYDLNCTEVLNASYVR